MYVVIQLSVIQFPLVSPQYLKPTCVSRCPPQVILSVSASVLITNSLLLWMDGKSRLSLINISLFVEPCLFRQSKPRRSKTCCQLQTWAQGSVPRCHHSFFPLRNLLRAALFCHCSHWKHWCLRDFRVVRNSLETFQEMWKLFLSSFPSSGIWLNPSHVTLTHCLLCLLCSTCF